MNHPIANCFRFAKIEHGGMVARAHKRLRRTRGKSAGTTGRRVPHPCRAATEPALLEVEGVASVQPLCGEIFVRRGRQPAVKVGRCSSRGAAALAMTQTPARTTDADEGLTGRSEER